MTELQGSSNADYHNNRTHLSSSSLKLLLDSPEDFERKYILNLSRPEESKPQFDEGSLVHAKILEPHNVDNVFSFFPGFRKSGNEFQEFLQGNVGKTIISAPQAHRCDRLVSAYSTRPEAVTMLEGGFKEHTVVGSVLGVPCKARFDYINVEKGYIADVKTTSYESGIDMFRETCKSFSYALSASLYCELAHQNFGKLFDFYFIVLSKSDYRCEVYKASSVFLSEGSAWVNQAIITYKKCKASGIWTREQPALDLSSANYEILEV